MQTPPDKLTPAPQPNSARSGRLAPADRIGIPGHIIIGELGERPGPAPKHVGPPPVAVAPVPLPAPVVE
ncbi:hypothetical protein OHB26_03610 [Nocardia sp. NBC_01503]|uniref:hypothetical protein n=1 Tax=Nocardia sp. NBC_01503 TaxID=2975997 RepID=UPI002E7C157C|nr:hypothetical protein [Nocardia sp. NBC_01503]WTL33343.1 hypothetical protein OHB26_03610 [Nocardia sp. NBC_01503]